MDNDKDQFEKVYEGNNKNCVIENLNRNTHYEIKICSKYNDLIGPWSQIKKVKTVDFDSIILSESQRGEEFLEKIFEWTGFKRIELLYREAGMVPLVKLFMKYVMNKEKLFAI